MMKHSTAGTILFAGLALSALGCSAQSEAGKPKNAFAANQTRPESAEPPETRQEKADKIVQAAPDASATDKAQAKEKAQALSDEEKFVQNRMELLEEAFGGQADPAAEKRKFVASAERRLEVARGRADMLLSESEALGADTRDALKQALAKTEKALEGVKASALDAWEASGKGADEAFAELEKAYHAALADLND